MVDSHTKSQTIHQNYYYTCKLLLKLKLQHVFSKLTGIKNVLLIIKRVRYKLEDLSKVPKNHLPAQKLQIALRQTQESNARPLVYYLVHCEKFVFHPTLLHLLPFQCIDHYQNFVGLFCNDFPR